MLVWYNRVLPSGLFLRRMVFVLIFAMCLVCCIWCLEVLCFCWFVFLSSARGACFVFRCFGVLFVGCVDTLIVGLFLHCVFCFVVG